MLKKLRNMPNAWKFLLIVLVFFGGLAILFPQVAEESIFKSFSLFKKIFSSLIFVFLFMFLFNIFITDKIVKKYLQKDIGIKKYLIVGLVGILSTGPIYMWYAYLSGMKKEGMNEGLISIFLYNRAVKLPLLPLMIEYFSLKTTIIITLLIIIFSFINSVLINLFNKIYNHENRNRVKN